MQDATWNFDVLHNTYKKNFEKFEFLFNIRADTKNIGRKSFYSFKEFQKFSMLKI